MPYGSGAYGGGAVQSYASAADSWSISDSARVSGSGRSGHDSWALSDSVADRTGKTVWEAWSISDAASRSAVLHRAQTESIAMSDGPVRVVMYHRPTGDSWFVSDVAPCRVGQPRLIYESWSIFDRANRRFFATTSDSMTISDVAVGHWAPYIDPPELLTLDPALNALVLKSAGNGSVLQGSGNGLAVESIPSTGLVLDGT